MAGDGVVPAYGADMRKEFMLRDNSVFLNHGAYGAKPRCVHQRQVKYLEELDSHPDIWYRYNMYRYLASAIATVADFMGVQAEDTFLLQNVTKAINTVQKTYPLETGDAILLTSLTYGAVKVTSRVRTETVKGSKLHFLDIKFPIESEEEIVKKYEDFLNNNSHVKLAVVDHITSPSSVLMPVRRLTELLHKHGVVVIIDGAHVPGQLAVDLQEIDADFYTGNLHKWVFCPRAAAFIWANPNRRHAWFRPLVTSAFEYQGLQFAFGYEGTKDDIPYLCTIDGIDFFNRIGGIEKIRSYNIELLKQGVDHLETKWGTKRLQVPANMCAPFLACIELPFLKGFSDYKEPEKKDNKSKNSESKDSTSKDSEVMVFLGRNLVLQKLILDTYDVQAAILIIDGVYMVRVCAQVYNTLQDYTRLADGVLDLATRQANKAT